MWYQHSGPAQSLDGSRDLQTVKPSNLSTESLGGGPERCRETSRGGRAPWLDLYLLL